MISLQSLWNGTYMKFWGVNQYFSETHDRVKILSSSIPTIIWKGKKKQLSPLSWFGGEKTSKSIRKKLEIRFPAVVWGYIQKNWSGTIFRRLSYIYTSKKIDLSMERSRANEVRWQIMRLKKSARKSEVWCTVEPIDRTWISSKPSF